MAIYFAFVRSPPIWPSKSTLGAGSLFVEVNLYPPLYPSLTNRLIASPADHQTLKSSWRTDLVSGSQPAWKTTSWRSSCGGRPLSTSLVQPKTSSRARSAPHALLQTDSMFIQYNYSATTGPDIAQIINKLLIISCLVPPPYGRDENSENMTLEGHSARVIMCESSQIAAEKQTNRWRYLKISLFIRNWGKPIKMIPSSLV